MIFFLLKVDLGKLKAIFDLNRRRFKLPLPANIAALA